MSEVSKPELSWKVLPFAELTLVQLYEALKLRVDVFVVEQACAYHELDGIDPDCHFILGMDKEGHVVATARIAPPGLIYPLVSVGRVAIHPSHRGLGYGYEIMARGIALSRDHFHAEAIKIAAQQYLEKFYQSLGFTTISESYLWDGIDHVDMIMKLNQDQ